MKKERRGGVGGKERGGVGRKERGGVGRKERGGVGGKERGGVGKKERESGKSWSWKKGEGGRGGMRAVQSNTTVEINGGISIETNP